MVTISMARTRTHTSTHTEVYRDKLSLVLSSAVMLLKWKKHIHPKLPTVPIKQIALFYGNPMFKLCINNSMFNQHVIILMFNSMFNQHVVFLSKVRKGGRLHLQTFTILSTLAIPRYISRVLTFSATSKIQPSQLLRVEIQF